MVKNKLRSHPFHANIDTEMETFSLILRGPSYVDLDRVLFVEDKQLSDFEYKQIGDYIEEMYDEM